MAASEASQPQAAQQLSFDETLIRIGQHLESEDVHAQQTACSTLCVLLAQSTEPVGDLGSVAASLCKLVASAATPDLQKNAAAAVAAAIECSEAAAQQAVDARLAETATQLLRGGPEDQGLAFNLTALLGALGAAGEAAARSALDAGTLEALLARCDPADKGAEQQEVAVDALCRLMAHSADAGAAAVDAGAIPRLAAMLGSSHEEVRVRALLGLGMLLGESDARQRQLAEAPGAVGVLMALMRQSDDLDSQHIAGELFRGLGRNPELRATLAVGVKAAHEQQQAEAAGNYV
eukprot:scaffold3.g6521.t1